jgi:polyphenol oxidase
VKPREQRKGEHTHRDHKPTDSTKTKTEPQKCEIVADTLGVDAATITKIKKRERWYHITWLPLMSGKKKHFHGGTPIRHLPPCRKIYGLSSLQSPGGIAYKNGWRWIMSNHYNESITEIMSRRRFLQQFGLASGAVGLGVFGNLALPQTALAVCDPPGNPGTPQRWLRDCRPIRPRRPASTLSNPEIQKLKGAYQSMRALDTSDPNDPRAFRHQANIHCWYCGEGTQVHFSWQFFVWHRAYLYFHERILGKLVGDMDFRLPYWDWDVSGHRKIPGAYTSPNDAANPLWNGTRFMSPTDEIPDEDVGDDVMESALTAGTFGEFGGSASSSGIPEGAPHGSVHVDVGGDMGAFDTAGRDPIFYAHHSNVDKIWSDWNKASSTHTNPTDSSFLNLAWNFYDENKIWRSITAAQVLNHENQLRYVYGPSRFLEALPCLLDWTVIRTDWRLERPLKLAATIQNRLVQTLEKGGRVRVHIRSMEVPIDKSAVYRIYATPEAARADEGPGGNGYVGSFPVVLNSLSDQRDQKGMKHKESSVRDVTINGSKRIVENLLRPPTPLEFTYVERGTKGEAHKPTPVRAKEIYFSTADVAKEA